MIRELLDIRKPAYNIAWYLAKYNKENHQKKYVYYYSLQVILGILLKATIMLSISLILGIFYQVLIFLIVFASIRIYSGGFHADTYMKCLLYTLLLALSGVYLSIMLLNVGFIYFNIIGFIIIIYITHKKAPFDNPNKPIISEQHRKNLKIKAIIANTLWFIISIILINNYSLFSNIIIIAMLFESFTLTNTFEKSSLTIEKYCTKICTL